MKPFTRLAVVVLWLIGLLQLIRFISRGEWRQMVPIWDPGHVANPLRRYEPAAPR